MTDWQKAKEAAAAKLASNDGYGWHDMPPYREGYLRLVREVIQSLRSSGYAIVPVKPTEGMLNAGPGEPYMDDGGWASMLEAWEESK